MESKAEKHDYKNITTETGIFPRSNSCGVPHFHMTHDYQMDDFRMSLLKSLKQVTERDQSSLQRTPGKFGLALY